MTIKRMLLLLSAMAAFVAFAAPAAQAESFWSTDPGDTPLGGPEEAVTFTGEGALRSTTSGITSGPTTVDAHGFLWNGETHGEGVIDNFEITGTEFPTSLSFLGCNVHEATNNTTSGNEGKEEVWPITLTTENVVDISNITFTNHYNAACQKLGLPAKASASGTATGLYNNATGCIEFNEAGDLLTETSPAKEVKLNGEVCIHEADGESTFTANTGE